MSLSNLQRRVAEVVFSLEEAQGFSLADGGALIKDNIVNRATRDFDCFGHASPAGRSNV